MRLTGDGFEIKWKYHKYSFSSYFDSYVRYGLPVADMRNNREFETVFGCFSTDFTCNNFY